MSEVNDFFDNLLKSKEFKDGHYDGCKDINYRISTGSLNLDIGLGGGIPNGFARFVGNSQAGKSSSSLEIARNFLKMFKDGHVIYYEAERKLSVNMKERVGLDFDDGRIRLIKSNYFETIFNSIQQSLFHFKQKKKILYIVDSMDGLTEKEHKDAQVGDSSRKASGAALTSEVLKRIGLPMGVFGHTCILISQVRSKFKIDRRSEDPNKDFTSASGGNAAIHAAEYTLQFEKYNVGDVMKEGESKKKAELFVNDAIGHMVKVKIAKSDNEKTLTSVTYPVRYGMKGKCSVWQEIEIFKILKNTGLLKCSGAWCEFLDGTIKEAKSKKIELKPKHNGENKFVDYLEENPKTKEFLYDYLKDTWK